MVQFSFETQQAILRGHLDHLKAELWDILEDMGEDFMNLMSKWIQEEADANWGSAPEVKLMFKLAEIGWLHMMESYEKSGEDNGDAQDLSALRN